ncbi:M18 family aminopeptidase [Ihubacter sp. mB4P-1]|uniref:M18 family aminopeptidase n=1 Tax=Ihubacter sp. mB4P-1 TaxID=3242370 RepID=UPI003C7B9A3E
MNDTYTLSQELLTFLDASPSCFHAVKNISDQLTKYGFTQLAENQRWEIRPGGKYFVTRNGSSLAAFTIPEKKIKGWRIAASHGDSPCLKIKENPEIAVENHYIQLNIERYGGIINNAWLDRPLSLAGRVIVKEDGRLVNKLVNIDRDLLLIPNIAPHLYRDINKHEYNMQKEMLPIYGDISAKGTFMKTVAEAAGVSEADILGHDLYLYVRQKGTVWGASREYIASSRLDDLHCAFASFKGFLSGGKSEHGAIYCLFDNEEVGSLTRQGAASTFLKDTMSRICDALSMSREDYLISLADSYMLSCDNAHAVHPSYTEKSDPSNRPYINEGIVIKYTAEQTYCSDGLSGAMFKDVCKRAGVPYQIFTNRSDSRGGSTLGNLSSAQVAVSTVDIGLPQLAMHSSYEIAGTKDTGYLVKAAEVFFE